MPSAYQNYLYHFSGDLYRPHHYHEDVISRHRQNSWAKAQAQQQQQPTSQHQHQYHNYHHQLPPNQLQQQQQQQQPLLLGENFNVELPGQHQQAGHYQQQYQQSQSHLNQHHQLEHNNQPNVHHHHPQQPLEISTNENCISLPSYSYSYPGTSLSPVTVTVPTSTRNCCVRLNESNELQLVSSNSSNSPLCSQHSINFHSNEAHQQKLYTSDDEILHHHHHQHHHLQSGTKSSQNSSASSPLIPPILDKMIKTVAKHFLDDERDRKYYADMYSCMPPPFFILTITLVELIFFIYYAIVNQVEVTTNGPIPADSIFIYRPDKKSEIWRFFLYMVLHAGWLHLIFNLLVQLLVGLPLEMVHGSVRIGVVYMAGVLAGSLATSVFDSNVYLVGASGGVYALLAAHLSNVLLNYNHLELGLLRVIGVFLIASVDVSIAIYNRYSSDITEGSVSYVAHLAGALAGLTIGLLVLKNFEQKLHEQLMWWMALGVYSACIILALLFNIFI